MGFFKAEVDLSRKYGETGIKVGLRGKIAPQFHITFTSWSADQIGLHAGDRVEVLIGDGEHRGLVRLRRDGQGAGFAETVGNGKGKHIRVNLGFQPMFGNEQQLAKSCNWEHVEDGYIEIVLPEWADKKHPIRPVEDKAVRAALHETVAVNEEPKPVPLPSQPIPSKKLSRRETLNAQAALLEEAIGEKRKGPIFERPKQPAEKKPSDERVVIKRRKPAAPNPEPMYVAPKKFAPSKPVSSRMQEASRRLFGDPPPSRSALAERQGGEA